MNRKYLFAGLVSFAALPCFGEVPMEISLLMKDGEFAKADSVIGTKEWCQLDGGRG